MRHKSPFCDGIKFASCVEAQKAFCTPRLMARPPVCVCALRDLVIFMTQPGINKTVQDVTQHNKLSLPFPSWRYSPSQYMGIWFRSAPKMPSVLCSPEKQKAIQKDCMLSLSGSTKSARTQQAAFSIVALCWCGIDWAAAHSVLENNALLCVAAALPSTLCANFIRRKIQVDYRSSQICGCICMFMHRARHSFSFCSAASHKRFRKKGDFHLHFWRRGDTSSQLPH
jgi:hypothetical protein